MCDFVHSSFFFIVYFKIEFIESRSSNHSNSAIQTRFSQNEQQLLRKNSATAKKSDTVGIGAMSKKRSVYSNNNGNKVTHFDSSYSKANRATNKSHSNENECECSSTSIQSLIESKSKMICNSKMSNSNNINKANIQPSSNINYNTNRQMNYNELETKIRKHVFTSINGKATTKLPLRSNGTMHLEQNAATAKNLVLRRSRTSVIENCNGIEKRKRSADPKVGTLGGLNCGLA